MYFKVQLRGWRFFFLQLLDVNVYEFMWHSQHYREPLEFQKIVYQYQALYQSLPQAIINLGPKINISIFFYFH